MMDKEKQIELIKEWRAESKKNWILLGTGDDVNRIYAKCADQLELVLEEDKDGRYKLYCRPNH